MNKRNPIIFTGLESVGYQCLVSFALSAEQDDFKNWHDEVSGVGTDLEFSETTVGAARMPSAARDRADRIFAPGQRAIVSDPRSIHFLNFWINFFPDVVPVVFYAPPAVWLERALSADESLDFANAIKIWVDSMRLILSASRKAPGRLILLNSGESFSYPSEFNLFLTSHLGLDQEAAFPVANVPISDPLALMLAEQFVRSEPRLRSLLGEIEARSFPLLESSRPRLEVQTDTQSALARFQDIHRRLRAACEETELLQKRFQGSKNECEVLLSQQQQVQEQLEAVSLEGNRLKSEIEKLRKDLSSSSTARDAQSKLAAELKAQLDAAVKAKEDQAKLAAARLEQAELAEKSKNGAEQENKLLVLQLHQVQEELEALFLEGNRRKSEIENLRKDLASSSAARGAQSKLAAELKAQLDAAVKANEDQAKLAAARLEQAELAENANGQARQENKLLLLQLHQVQEELEHYYLEWKKIEMAPKPFFAGNKSTLRANVTARSAHDTPPHRHLSFFFSDLDQNGRKIDSMEVRLAEHNGHPGIIFFLPDGNGTPPIPSWKESGREEGRPYMLIFPSNPQCRQLLFEATTSEFLFVRDSLGLIQGTLATNDGNAEKTNPPPARDQFWLWTARRLQDQFNGISDHIHLDEISGSIPGDGSRILQFEIRSLLFRDRLVPPLTISWTPDSIKSGSILGNLTFRYSREGIPPFDAWPQSADGVPMDEWEPVFLSGHDPAEARKQWRQLAPDDQALSLALLAELPAFVAHLMSKHPEARISQEKLDRQARSALKKLKELGTLRNRKSFFSFLSSNK